MSSNEPLLPDITSPPFKVTPDTVLGRSGIKKIYDAGMTAAIVPQDVPEHLLPLGDIDTTFDREEVVTSREVPYVFPAFTGLQKAMHERLARRNERRIRGLAEDSEFTHYAARVVMESPFGAGGGNGKVGVWRDADPSNPDDAGHMRPNTRQRQQTLWKLEKRWHKRGHAVRLQGGLTSPFIDARTDAAGKPEFFVDYHKSPADLSPAEDRGRHKVAHHVRSEDKVIKRIDEGLPGIRKIRKGGIAGITQGSSAKAERARKRWEKSVAKVDAIDQKQQSSARRRS